MLLAVLPIAFAQSFTLAAPPEPKAGEPVRLVVAWTNDAPTAVRIPANWASELEVHATWVDPNGPRMGYGTGGGTPRVDAGTVAWVAVGPGSQVTSTVDLAAHLPERCRPGCAAGTYDVSVGSWRVVYANAEADQVGVSGHASVEIVVAPVITRRPLTELLEVGVVPSARKWTLVAEITFTNIANAPVWVSPDWLGTCTWTRGRQGGGETRAAGGQPAWVDESGWRRLAPGATEVRVQHCGEWPGRTKGIRFELDLTPVSGFLPVDPHPGEFSAEGPLVIGDLPR